MSSNIGHTDLLFQAIMSSNIGHTDLLFQAIMSSNISHTDLLFRAITNMYVYAGMHVHPEDAERMSYSVDTNQTALSRNNLILVSTFCTDLSPLELIIFMINRWMDG